MADRLDELDRKILLQLQQDTSPSIEDIARSVGSSKTPVWNRIRKMRERGIIKREVAVLDADALGFEACFFVLIRTSEHDAAWQNAFLKALRERPEVQEAHRLAGDIDYILKVRVANARAYDVFYQALISEVKIHNPQFCGQFPGIRKGLGLIGGDRFGIALKIIEVKEVKFRPNTDTHDYEVKMRNVVKFLEKGDKVKVTLRFRGREMAHQNLGRELLERVAEDIKEIGKVENMPKMEGRQMIMMIGPVAK
eukprot:g19509.t1